jgi:hypothetical protein
MDPIADMDPVLDRLDGAADELGDIGVPEPSLQLPGGSLASGAVTDAFAFGVTAWNVASGSKQRASASQSRCTIASTNVRPIAIPPSTSMINAQCSCHWRG